MRNTVARREDDVVCMHGWVWWGTVVDVSSSWANRLGRHEISGEKKSNDQLKKKGGRGKNQ